MKAHNDFWDDEPLEELPHPTKSRTSPTIHHVFYNKDGTVAHSHHPRQHADQLDEYVHDNRR